MAKNASTPREETSGRSGATASADFSGLSAYEKGAPVSDLTIDSELIHLGSNIPHRSPLVAAAALLLALILLWKMRTDIKYSFQSDTPHELSDTHFSHQRGILEADRYVALTGVPDYRHALTLQLHGERSRSYLLRLHGNTSQNWILVPDSTTNELAHGPFIGRIRFLDDLSFASSLHNFYRGKSPISINLDVRTLQALSPGPLPLSMMSRAGLPVVLTPLHELIVEVLFPDDLRIILSKDRFPSEADARHEVERLGAPVTSPVETGDAFSYVLRLPFGSKRNQLLFDADARGILFWHRIESYCLPASSVHLQIDGLSVNRKDIHLPSQYFPDPQDPHRLDSVNSTEGNLLLEWPQIQTISVLEPLDIEPNAMILLAGESPKSLRWIAATSIMLLLVITFNVWYLWLGAREKTRV